MRGARTPSSFPAERPGLGDEKGDEGGAGHRARETIHPPSSLSRDAPRHPRADPGSVSGFTRTPFKVVECCTSVESSPTKEPPNAVRTHERLRPHHRSHHRPHPHRSRAHRQRPHDGHARRRSRTRRLRPRRAPQPALLLLLPHDNPRPHRRPDHHAPALDLDDPHHDERPRENRRGLRDAPIHVERAHRPHDGPRQHRPRLPLVRPGHPPGHSARH